MFNQNLSAERTIIMDDGFCFTARAYTCGFGDLEDFEFRWGRTARLELRES
eukprot:SAG11_NODE_47_length_20431_cov_7.472752_4_plen_51_part_00